MVHQLQQLKSCTVLIVASGWRSKKAEKENQNRRFARVVSYASLESLSRICQRARLTFMWAFLILFCLRKLIIQAFFTQQNSCVILFVELKHLVVNSLGGD